MKNKNKKKEAGKMGVLAVFIMALAVVLGIILLRVGIAGTIIQKGGAVIANSWQRLFGGATYDVDPRDAYDSDDQDVSSTDSSAATSSFDAPSSPPAAKKTANKPVASVPAPSAPIVSATSAAEITPPPSCAFPSARSSLSAPKIILNEVAWMGSTSSANDEWIELKNISSSSVDLAGWSVMDASGAIKIIFAAGDTVPAGGLFLLARGTGGTVSLIAQKIYSGGLSNTGGELAVMDSQCNAFDLLDASSGWPDGDNVTKQTLERAADHVSWQTSALGGGTPGAENSSGVLVVQKSTSGASTATATSSSATTTSTTGGAPATSTNTADTTWTSATATSTNSGTNATTTVATSTDSTATSTAQTSSTASAFCPATHVVIAEVQIAGASSANDFIKLYNPTGASIDMSGWRLRKKSSGGTDASVKVLGKGSAIAAHGYFTWANSANGFAASLGADVSSTETLAADNSAALMDASGTIIDEVAWGTGTGQYVEGTAVPTDPAANQILERTMVGDAIGDSDDNAIDFALH